MRLGTVISSKGNRCTVTDGTTGEAVECVVRGKIRLAGSRNTNPVAVGDRVKYHTDTSGQGVVDEIEPRRNYVIRRASNLSKETHIIAANLDQAAIVATLVHPTTKEEFIDRFLVTCEAYDVPAAVILNKSDMFGKAREFIEEFCATYNSAGYKVIVVSAKTGVGMDELGQYLEGKSTLLAGNSGVGKSSIIKNFVPDQTIKTASVSTAHGKGKHTTTFATMYALPQGGNIIDTPGIKGFGLIEITPEELKRYFPEFMKYSPDCRYYNCTHTGEPDCAVMQAVAEGRIADSRYTSYLKMLEEDGKYR